MEIKQNSSCHWVRVRMGKEQRELSGAVVIFCNLADVHYTGVHICQNKKGKQNVSSSK